MGKLIIGQVLENNYKSQQ